MLIKNLQVGHLETNCYIVTDENTLDCVIIDPGDESNTIMDYIESSHLNPKAIFLTHGHFDHTRAADAVSEETGVPIWICSRDFDKDGGSGHYKFCSKGDIQFYKDGDSFTVGGLTFHIMETPGHSEGGVTIRCGGALFVGDTLFRDSCGRTDLPGGDMDVLLRSLYRLYTLEGDFEVYPGHMEATTLDRERRFNYYMKCAMERN